MESPRWEPPGTDTGWWLEWEKQEMRKRGCLSFYLDFFRCSSSGSCTERAEADIDQKTEGHPSPKPWQRGSQGAKWALAEPRPGLGASRRVRPALGCHLLNSVPVRWARMRKERDWPVPGRGRQSSVSSISRCLLASGTSGRSGCLWGGCGSEPHVESGQWGQPLPWNWYMWAMVMGEWEGQGWAPAGWMGGR